MINESQISALTPENIFSKEVFDEIYDSDELDKVRFLAILKQRAKELNLEKEASSIIKAYNDADKKLAQEYTRINAQYNTKDVTEKYVNDYMFLNAKKIEEYKKEGFTDEEIRQSIINTYYERLEEEKENAVYNAISELDPQITTDWKDYDFATLFADVYENKCRFNSTAKEWYFYNGKKWVKDNCGLFTSYCSGEFYKILSNYYFNKLVKDKTYSNNHNIKILNLINNLGNENKRQALVRGARERHHIDNKSFDTNGNLFNCQNGTLDLGTYQFKEHSHSDLLSKISNIVYDPEAKCPLWEKFINEILQKDNEKIEYLQKILGYSLTTSTELETCFVFYGATTRNGKSTLIETIMYLMGEYALNIKPETLAKKKNNDSRTANGDIARLYSCRFVNASEPPKNMIFDVSLLKTLLGNDTITARELYQSEFDFTPKFKLFINTNYLPTVADKTLFASGRINVITFDRHFGDAEQDKQLKNKLKAENEISGIFNWLLEGLKNYCCYGAVPPKSVQSANEEYKNSNDKIKNFFDECMEYKPGHCCKLTNVYDRYQRWCRDSNFGIESKKNFKLELIANNLFKESGTVDGATVRNVIVDYGIVYENNW